MLTSTIKKEGSNRNAKGGWVLMGSGKMFRQAKIGSVWKSFPYFNTTVYKVGDDEDNFFFV